MLKIEWEVIMNFQLPTVVFVSKTREEFERYCLACDISGFEVGDYDFDCRYKPANPQNRTPNCLVMNTFESRDNLALESNRDNKNFITSFCIDIAGAIKRLFGQDAQKEGVVNVFVHWGGGTTEGISNLENTLNKTLDTIPIFGKWRIISLSSLRPELIHVESKRINLPTTAEEFTNLILKGVMGCPYKDQLTAYVCNKKPLQDYGKWLPWLLSILEDEIRCGLDTKDSQWMLNVIGKIRNVQTASLEYDVDGDYAALFSRLLQMGLL